MNVARDDPTENNTHQYVTSGTEPEPVKAKVQEITRKTLHMDNKGRFNGHNELGPNENKSSSESLEKITID